MSSPTMTLTETIDATNIRIMTVKPANVAAPDLLISWERRTTEKTPISEAERFRGILVPESALLIPHSEVSSRFLVLLQSQIHELACARLTEYLKANPAAREVPASFFTLSSLLLWAAAERKRQQITGETITAWLQASATFDSLSDKQRIVWLRHLPKIASPAYRAVLNKENAASVISRLADNDLEHPVALFLIDRLNNIINAVSEAEEF